VRDSNPAFRRHLRAGLFSAGAAFVGFIALAGFLVVDVRPGPGPLLAFAVATPTLAAFCARKVAVRAPEIWGFTFGCVLLGWPVLAFAALIVRYWITGQSLGN
jgi:hypothetical protein